MEGGKGQRVGKGHGIWKGKGRSRVKEGGEEKGYGR